MCALHEDKRFDELVASLGLDPERVVGLELRLHKDEITTDKIEELVYDDQWRCNSERLFSRRTVCGEFLDR